MNVPDGVATYEFTVKRSRFIGQARGAGDRREAEAIIETVRAEHPDARHVVYAFVIGDPKSELLGMSDDGEPHGTAGRPVLDVLRGSGVTDCVVTVVRYFGGTKLGTGGLVHAYGDAAKGCLAKLAVKTKRNLLYGNISVPYELHQTTKAVFTDVDGEMVEESFGAEVEMRWGIPVERREKVEKALLDVSRGTLHVAFEDVHDSGVNKPGQTPE